MALVSLLAACGDPRDVPLVGDREAVGSDQVDRVATLATKQAPPLRLVGARENASWTHRMGAPSHVAGHPALAATPQQIWSAPIGAGNSRKNRIAGEPIVAAGAVFTMDSQSQVTATSLAGERLWSVDLTPTTENSAHGGAGGLAFGDNTIFATTGFGELVALDPQTGGEVWTQDLDAAGGAAPTYFDGRVYVAARDSLGWAVDANSGRILWQVVGTPSGSNILGGPGVAVNDRLAIFPFAAGELVAVFRQGGIRLWNAAILGKRSGLAISRITDISGDPVIADDTVYAANPAGRVVALDIVDGSRLWTANEGAFGPPVVAGTSLFLVNDRNELVRLDRETGARIWSRPLPLFVSDKERRKTDIFAHYGPVLAGNQLWLGSSDGQLRSFDPKTGNETQAISVAGGVATAPVVAGRTLYVVSGRGQLHAFR